MFSSKRKKIGKQKIQGTMIASPFEDALDLITTVRLELRGQRVGAFYLQKSNGAQVWVFGWTLRPLHSSLRQEEVDAVFDKLESGLKDLPPAEHVTFQMGSFSGDYERQEQMAALVQECPSADYRFLMLSEQARIREITDIGIRKPKFWHVYITYTVEPDVKGDDWVEKTISRTEQAFSAMAGTAAQRKEQMLHTAMIKAFDEGYCRYQQFLSNKLGLDVRPMSEDALWQHLWRRFNGNTPRPLPQLLIVGEKTLREEISSTIHAHTRLLESGAPEASEEWVCLTSRIWDAESQQEKLVQDYIGVLTLLDKPGGWTSKWQQLRSIWEILSRPDVRETEIFCELTRGNDDVMKNIVQRVGKQASVVTEKTKTDVVARVKMRRSEDAQEKLYDGELGVYEAVVILVHRPTTQQLNDACRQMESFFRRPALVQREKLYAWKIWLQTLPIVAESLLLKPFERRVVFLSGETIGLLPLVGTKVGDRQGVEFICEEGGSPFLIDPFSKHEAIGIFSTTRGGKSVLFGRWFLEFLVRGYPVVGIDFPKPDGTSTFTDFTRFVGGSYFDIARESNNLMEKPDFTSLNLTEKQVETRTSDWVGFLQGALQTMILGKLSDPLLEQSVRSVVVIALDKFLQDEGIINRYEMARLGGLGSMAWQEVPTIEDFQRFVSIDDIGVNADDDSARRAVNLIRLQLSYWMRSAAGKAISRPSSFRTDSQLLVFALTNLGNDAEAGVMALSAYGAALRRALSSEVSGFFCDESPILFEYPEIANMIGRLFANGEKAGLRPFLSAQDPDTIANSPAGKKIFQNMTTKCMGRILPAATESFTRILQFPEEVVRRAAAEAFFPDPNGIYSKWFIEQRSRLTEARFYPGTRLLGVVANNRDEQSARDRAFAKYPNNKYQAVAHFSEELVASMRMRVD
jgi:hypothetical protein